MDAGVSRKVAGAPEPTTIRIRNAQREDLPVLVRLRESVGWSSGGVEAGFANVESGRQVLLLAEMDGRTVGAVAASFQVPASGGFGRGHISDLLVTPLWRRRGVGTALLAAAERAVRARGLGEVTLDVDAENRGALALYARNGYVHYRPAQFPWGPGYTLRKVLDEPPGSPQPARWWRRWSRS